MPADSPVKRRRILVSDLHLPSFKKVDTEDGQKIAITPARQIIAHGADPNAISLDPNNGLIAFASNGNNITRTWTWDGTKWIGD